MPVVTQSLSHEITQLHADICSALADPNRILLLYALSEHPYTVNDLAESIGLSQPATSRHLKTLKRTRPGACQPARGKCGILVGRSTLN